MGHYTCRNRGGRLRIDVMRLSRFSREGNLPFKPVRKLQELRYVLLAGTLMSAVAVPQLSVALEGLRGTDGRLIVAQRDDPKDKNKQQNKGQPGGQQPKQGGQPPNRGPGGPGGPGATGQQGGQPGGQGGQQGG